ncbi:MAG: dihydropteroate synthase [Ignavibacteriales bacterium CG_4_9_14_3_um_filter_30_11]|nr:MAG: dihydropteroate synthase [Ignavibacteriales bacterium CG_4_9_14_3_um_filter_30_11]
MILQIINLSHKEVFKKYSILYNIYRDVYRYGLLAMEIRSLPKKLANTTQKIILSNGEICYKYSRLDSEQFNILFTGSLSDLFNLSRKILTNGDEELGYQLLNCINNYEKYDDKSYKIGEKLFSFNKAYVMGILNVTKDSFSDGGKNYNKNDAINYALKMIENGADVIDIGGESTRPGAEGISVKEEIERIIPVVKGVINKNPNSIISIDTTKSKVAELALQEGAKIINDVNAFKKDPELIKVVKKYNASYILMHMKGTPKNMQDNPTYNDVVKEIYDFLFNKIKEIKKLGINNIFIDPGIGFGKKVEDNFQLLKRLEDFKSLGHPLLVGVSRKSFIGKTLDIDVDKRDTASAIVEALAIKNGTKIIRTHNVENGVQICKLLNNLN